MNNTSLNNASLNNANLDQANGSAENQNGSEVAMDDIPVAERDVVTPAPLPQSSPRTPRSKRLLWQFIGLGALAFGITLGLNYQYGILTQLPWQTDNSQPIKLSVQPSPTASPSSSTQQNSTSDTSASSEGDSTLPSDPTSATTDTPEDLLGHLPYEEAETDDLENITADGAIKLHKDAARSYLEMVDAARRDDIILAALSGFRTVDEQEYLFFEIKKQRGQDASKRAEVSAPPGHSEHHTGYAIDIGDADVPDSHLSESFEKTKAFEWLQENAAFYSFELSFPRGNPQGVSYEPWHWRYVGDRDSLETFYKDKPKTTPPVNLSKPSDDPQSETSNQESSLKSDPEDDER